MTKEDISIEHKILDSATVEFAEYGFSGARTEMIAKRAEVSKSMLHYYYRTKDLLFQSVLEHILVAFIESNLVKYVSDFEEDGLNTAQKLYITLMLFSTSRFLVSNEVHVFKLILREMLNDESIFKTQLINYRHKLEQIEDIRGLIVLGVKEGFFEVSNVEYAVLSFKIGMNVFSLEEYFSGDLKKLSCVDNISFNSLYETVYMIVKIFLKTLQPEGKPFFVPKLPKVSEDRLNKIIRNATKEKKSNE
ncbi:MAG: TetR family transcriptional regulator [Candidatus Margulisbacteria bacterium]|nr:TetR family transcriptional regulator [Candidatus Margulisiibacteriota bacterium]